MSNYEEQNFKNEMEAVFKLLSNHIRLNILIMLENKQFSVNEIVDALEVPQSQISHQLAILKKNQLVSSEKIGQKNFYKLDDSHILNVIESTENHVKHVLQGKSHDEA